MARRSGGILLYRRAGASVRVLLVHPGGPFWARKDEGAWSIPKGEYEEPGEPLDAALREFREELGCPPPGGAPLALGTLRQPGGKLVTAWALEGDLDPDQVVSNTFTLRWPPRGGTPREFPEVDRAAWFALPEARRKILRGQAPFIDALLAALGLGEPPPEAPDSRGA